MPTYVYVAAQDDNKVSVFNMEAGTGKLTPKAEVPIPDGPHLLAISPDRKVIYVGQRGLPGISSWQIDQNTGDITQNGSVSTDGLSDSLSTDRKGKYLLSAQYQAGHVSIHPLADDGSLGAPATEHLATDIGAHAIYTDPSNRFAYVPHIARLFDNVLEPPKDELGPNVIYQFRFDENTGHLTPNSPLKIEQDGNLGPRYYCFHPTQDIVYFSDEQGCSVTAYHMDSSVGTLSAFQTITTLPEGVTQRNTCSQIQISPTGKFLYVPNRGHNSIACFSVDSSTGRLSAIGQVPTEAVPSAFSLDPEGKFVFAAGSATGRLAAYRINDDMGELTPLETYPVGERPMGVLVTSL